MLEAKVTKSRTRRSPAGEKESGLAIHGGPLSDFTIIPSSTLALLCGVGQSDGEQVLVPYVQVRLLEPEGEAMNFEEDGLQVTEAVKMTLGFENTAFLIMDLARDFRAVSRHLVAAASGELKPPPSRIAYALDCIQRAKTAMEGAADVLSELAELPKAPPRAPVRPRPVAKTITPRKRKA